jgi:hypothetical protein
LNPDLPVEYYLKSISRLVCIFLFFFENRTLSRPGISTTSKTRREERNNTNTNTK